MLDIRPSNETDIADIDALHQAAFGEPEGPEIVELVNLMFGDKSAKPLLSLVATENGELLGHILFSKVEIVGSDNPVSAQILAPMAVAPERHGEGIGGKLIAEGLKRLKADGVELVFVLGHPTFYPRYGFKPAGVLGFEATHPIPDEYADAWMVQELTDGVIESCQGKVMCSDILGQPKYWGP